MKLLLLLLFTYRVIAADFSVVVDKPFNAALFDITEDYDRTISAVGFSNEYRQHNDSQKSYKSAYAYLEHLSTRYGTQMTLLKVSQNGGIIFDKLAKLNRFNKAVALVKTPQNGYFVGGYTLDGSLIVAKLDANAKILFVKFFGTKNYDRMNNLIALSDGGVLAVGSSFTSRNTQDAMFATGLGNNDIFLTRFAKNGTILWSKKYGTEYDDNGIDATEAQDGSLVVISTMSAPNRRSINFMRITENGNKIWLKELLRESDESKNMVPNKIIRLRDNNFVVALTQYNQIQQEHIRLVKFDLYQNILQDKEVPTRYPSSLLDIKEFSNGTLMGVGYVKDKTDTDALVMHIGSNLQLLRQNHYGSQNFDAFYAVTILHNSNVAAAGLFTPKNAQESHMWIKTLNPQKF